MTRHVVTRWYRAPEIMCWDEYNKPVDTWAAACILAELFLRRPIFPGDHFVHQLNLIFDVIGTSSKEDRAFITEDTILLFLQRLPQKVPRKWENILKDTQADAAACDLLSKILIFNPKKRLPVDEILAHSFFSHWHDPADEPVGDKVISMECEDTEDIETIKDMLWEEAVVMTRKNLAKK